MITAGQNPRHNTYRERKPVESLKRIYMEAFGRPKYIRGRWFESTLISDLRSHFVDGLYALTIELSTLPFVRTPAGKHVDSKTVMSANPDGLEAAKNTIIASLWYSNTIPDDKKLIAPISMLNEEDIKALGKVIAKCRLNFIERIRRPYFEAYDTVKMIALILPFELEVRLKKEIVDMFRHYVKEGFMMCTMKENLLKKIKQMKKKELIKKRKQLKKVLSPKVPHQGGMLEDYDWRGLLEGMKKLMHLGRT